MTEAKLSLLPPFVPEWTTAGDPQFPVKISLRAAKKLYWHVINASQSSVGLLFYVNDFGMQDVGYADARRLDSDEYWISSFGRIPIAVRIDDAAFFKDFLLDRTSFPPCVPNIHIVPMREGLVASASDPGRLSLSFRKLQLFHPELFQRANVFTKVVEPILRVTSEFGSQPKDKSWIGRWIGTDDMDGQAQAIESIASNLSFGDANPAVVVHERPLTVAAFSPDIDNVMLLRLPDSLADGGLDGLLLRRGDRLVTCNSYGRNNEPFDELPLGPRASGQWNDVWCVIANLISEDQERLDMLRASFSDEAWSRCEAHARRRMEAKDPCRDGRPNFSRIPIVCQRIPAFRIRGGYLK